MFDREFFDNYASKVRPLIQNILTSERKAYVRTPTLFEEQNPGFIESLETAFYVRQSRMKEGFIAQILLGN